MPIKDVEIKMSDGTNTETYKGLVRFGIIFDRANVPEGASCNNCGNPINARIAYVAPKGPICHTCFSAIPWFRDLESRFNPPQR